MPCCSRCLLVPLSLDAGTSESSSPIILSTPLRPVIPLPKVRRLSHEARHLAVTHNGLGQLFILMLEPTPSSGGFAVVPVCRDRSVLSRADTALGPASLGPPASSRMPRTGRTRQQAPRPEDQADAPTSTTQSVAGLLPRLRQPCRTPCCTTVSNCLRWTTAPSSSSSQISPSTTQT